jgi:hypothetical protein
LAVALGVGLGIALGGDDDDDDRARPRADATESPPAGTIPAPPTATAEAPGPEAPPAPPPRDPQRAEIEQVVSELVEASERGDAEGLCFLVGQDPGGAIGLQALQACARRAGVDLSLIPTSDELTLVDIRIRGDRARAKFASGATVLLMRAADRWRIDGLNPP